MPDQVWDAAAKHFDRKELAALLLGAMKERAKEHCFFQSAAKFKTRYAVLGFSDEARLDDGAMWSTSYALTGLTADDEAGIGALVRQAVS